MQKITLKKIDETNFLSAFGLKLREGQERFVSHPVRSLAQAYVYYHQCTPFGIFCDEQMVGYVMVIYDYDLAEYNIWHMMIEKDRQGLGYGTAALQRCLEYDHIGDLTDCEVICLLVGERPGLVTNESMSAYLTYRPHTGIAESCRTVVSNIHRQGVSAVEAGAHIASLIGRILAQKASGIGLREDGA